MNIISFFRVRSDQMVGEKKTTKKEKKKEKEKGDVAVGSPAAAARLKREDCRRTKQDSAFSKWEILIGPSDWENHSLGKDGAERYRIHNLPLRCSCPGVYELGIAKTATDEQYKTRKFDPRNIVVVYLGQADNIRTRLQQYGRAGSHLDHGNSVTLSNKNKSNVERGPGLFKEIFLRGFSIMFRWAPMESKLEAMKTEALMLAAFDYAWNRQGNGAFRRDGILLKLENIQTKNTFHGVLRKFKLWRLRGFRRKQVGIRVNGSNPPKEYGATNDQNDNLNTRLFKFPKIQPRIVQQPCNLESEYIICGVAKEDGSVCRNRPVLGRKRCGEHKGKRVDGTKPLINRGGSTTEKSVVCGLRLEYGSVCLESPSHGRKRCELHKGRRNMKPKFNMISQN